MSGSIFKRIAELDTPPRIDVAEYIDDPAQPFDDLRHSMTDVQRANRYLGGTAVVSRQADSWLRAAQLDTAASGRIITILDVATGSGDLPKAIQQKAKLMGVCVHIIGLDFSAPILKFASEPEQAGGRSGIRLLQGDAFRLPFKDASIDYVVCSLAFHHFGLEGSIRALREMDRVARLGWLVNDLRRAWSAWYLFRAVSAVTKMNRMTRHDGPASVLRAYTLAEYRLMAEAMALTEGIDYSIRSSLWYRVALVGKKKARSL